MLIPAHWEAIMGGSQYQAKLLINALLGQNRYDIFYLTSRINPKFQPVAYKIIQVAERKGIRRYGYFFDAPRLLNILQDIAPDVIYQRVGCAWTGIAAYYARKNKCKVVWHIAHDRTIQPFDAHLSPSLPFRYIERKMLDFGIMNVDKIVAQTEWQKRMLEARYQRSAVVIPNFHPVPKEEIIKRSPITVVWIANLKPWKRPELFIRLANDLCEQKNTKFIMVGKPMADLSVQEEFLETIECIENLSYLGECSQKKVNEILATAHIFVNTSRYEGFANTFIQAWMRRVPVISLDVNPDCILSKEDVGFFSDNCYEKMKEQVVALIKDEKLREKVGRQAQEYAMQFHSESNIDRLIEVLNK